MDFNQVDQVLVSSIASKRPNVLREILGYQTSLAAFFAVYLGAPAAWSLSSAVLSLLGAGTAYYSYTHTSWRTNGILYVRSTVTIYSYSNYTGYVTATTINKQYSDNMLD